MNALLLPTLLGALAWTAIAQLAAPAHRKMVVPHHGGGNLGTVAQLHCIASGRMCEIEILYDPPIAAYINGFSIFDNPPLVDREGYMPLSQGPGLGVTCKK
jgi:L-alanine-DL-glutamate epimerase-like enolase superfamily enzyme